MSSMKSAALTLASAFLSLSVTAGCQSSGGGEGGGGMPKAGLPPSAERVAEGSGQLTYTAEEQGRVFLYDVNQDRVVGRYEMRRGQRLAVDAAAGRATLDGNEVSVGELKAGGSYRVYFIGR